MGDEVKDPVRTIPRSIIISILVLATLYVLLQLAVNATIPWQSLAADPNSANAQFVAATVVSKNWGAFAGKFVTFMILVTAFASAYGSLLGFARIPYAAALDGAFLKPFAKLHPTGRFPYVSVLVIGLLTLPAACLPLTQVINWLTAGIVLIQAIAQIVALAVLRARGDMPPFRMWLYPLPPLIALGGWVLLFVSTGVSAIVFGVAHTFNRVRGVLNHRASAARVAVFKHMKRIAAALAAVVLCAVSSPPAAPESWAAQIAAMFGSAIDASRDRMRTSRQASDSIARAVCSTSVSNRAVRVAGTTSCSVPQTFPRRRRRSRSRFQTHAIGLTLAQLLARFRTDPNFAGKTLVKGCEWKRRDGYCEGPRSSAATLRSRVPNDDALLVPYS